MGKNAKLKEKQKWSQEKLHLDNARKLRGIYFIDPEDKEFKETIKNARKKLETSVAPAKGNIRIVGVVHPIPWDRGFLFRPPIPVKITRILQKTPEFRENGHNDVPV